MPTLKENRMQRRLWLTLMASGAMLNLAACGFELRKAPNFAFKTLFSPLPEGSPLGVELKRSLESSGAALGSWHPLQTFSLPAGEPAALAGSPAVIEGDPRALVTGRELADLLHLRPVIEIAGDRKASYHAGAVFASNYLVVLADIAARLARDAGADGASAQLFLPLMRRTLANYGTGGVATLTGPISRGDADTVARHLEALEGSERALYIALGREALRLAAASGLDPHAAKTIEQLLY